MANIGYLQVVRHCNHFCGFCSNPSTPYSHTFETMRRLVDDLVERGYFGVVLTGGEPTLHPELPRIAAYAHERGLHVRIITNGHRLADPVFARDLAAAGVAVAHVSVYSVRPEIEAAIRGVEGTLERAFAGIEHAREAGIEVNVNCVINKLNSDHLDENVRHFLAHHPHVRHFVWNNLDPSMGRAEVNQERFTPRLADFELSLFRALRLLERSGRSFRVERVPLCYMTEFAWASTETRKIVKGEERLVCFLDAKQTVQQTEWGHGYADACQVCRLRPICGGLFDHGGAYDPAELCPVFVDPDPIVERILTDGSDPSFRARTLAKWKATFAGAPRPHGTRGPQSDRAGVALAVGELTPEGRRLFEQRRLVEAERAARKGIALEILRDQLPVNPDEGATGRNSSQP